MASIISSRACTIEFLENAEWRDHSGASCGIIYDTIPRTASGLGCGGRTRRVCPRECGPRAPRCRQTCSTWTARSWSHTPPTASASKSTYCALWYIIHDDTTGAGMSSSFRILEKFHCTRTRSHHGRQNRLRHVYTHRSSRGLIHAISFMGHVSHITGVAGRPLRPPERSAVCRERRRKAPIGARDGSRPTEYRARSAIGHSCFI